jgi:copper chaperone CopZ
MRRFLLVGIGLLIVGVTIGFFTVTRHGRAQQSVSQADTTVVTIPVEGMVCLACTARVKSALKGIDGVTDVEVNLEDRVARVQYAEDKVSPEQLVSAINRLGYRAGIPQPEKGK